MSHIRPAAVAGLFYPREPQVLRQMVDRFLLDNPSGAAPTAPVALIVPHAGLVYSGPVAARTKHT